jgi:glycosyltransferase involved in cell wall biosynthesis
MPVTTGSGSPARGPLVSVIVPTFNRTRYLGEAVASALGQTYANLEVLIADDASTEDVRSFVEARFHDPRVRYDRNAVNLGMGPNTWGALARASGKYVATVHDDDVWEPDFLSTLVPVLEADDSLSVAYCDHHIIDEHGVLDPAGADLNTRLWKRDKLARGIVRPLERFLTTIPAAMAAVFRKSAIDWADFPAEVGTHYDLWLSYLAARTGHGYYEPRRLTRYRVHQQSETAHWTSNAGKIRALRQSEFILRRQVTDPAFSASRADLRTRYVRISVALALALLEDGQTGEFRLSLRASAEFLERPELKLALAASHLPDAVLTTGVSAMRQVQRRFLRRGARGP